MNCPNCNHPYEEGAAACPECGAPLPTGAAPAAAPPSGDPSRPAARRAEEPSSTALPYAILERSTSNSMALASLVIGILVAVLVALVVVVAVTGLGGTLKSLSPADVQTFAQNSGTGVICIGLGFLASPVLGLFGLIFGLLGLKQEKLQPTRGGRTRGIIGVALSCLPLLCCLSMIIAQAAGLSLNP